MKKQHIKHRLHAATCGVFSLGLLGATPIVYAEASATVNFQIPAQKLIPALSAFAEQSGVQLLYSSEMAEPLRAAPLHGRHSVEQGLRHLLTGTGIGFRFVEPGVVTLEKRAAPADPTAPRSDAATLAPMTVTGSAEYDSTDPYNTDYNRPNAVTATKTDTPLMQTPLSVKVVPQQVLKDQQVITVDQALRNVSGVVTGAGGSGTFFIRGFGNYNVYRDGYLNQSQWAHTEDLENVERVEVLKGPGSVLYGRTEPGGLVNFVTKQPLNTPYYSLRQQFGSFDHYRTSVDATGPLTDSKDLAYRFNLGYQSNHTFQEFGGDERLFVAPSLRWNISDRTTSTFKIEYSDIKELGRGTVPLMGNRPAPIPRSRNLGDPWNIQEDEYFMLSLNTVHAFNENWKLQHRFNFTNHTLTMSGKFPTGAPVQPNGDQTRFFFAQNIDDNDYQHNFFNALELSGKFDTGFLKHNLLIGGDYYRTDYRATSAGFTPKTGDTTDIYHPIHQPGPPAILPGDVDLGEWTLPWFGLYAQDQIELPYHLHALAGLRYDNATSSWHGSSFPDTSADKVSPRGGLVWQPIPEFSLYGSYTENFGASNFYDWSTKTPLPPQTAQQWEVGAKTELFDGRFSATLAYFDLTKQNLPMSVGPGITKAVGEAESRGIEFDLSGEILPGWSIIGAYAYTPFAKTIKDSAGFGNSGKRLNNAPEHSGSLWTTYEFQKPLLQGVKIGAGMQAVGQREIGYNETAQAPGYVTMNMMLSKFWKIGASRVTAQLNIDNLTDKTYFGSIYSYGPSQYGAPRTFMGAIRIEY
ncbi:TonB-dependent siderophore receptor [Methylomicrobium lacus]|uniref:TonB-dependent siderophore receptor n=1 Tax=Methylomicrobium lacus TaxID=136992 RepID=UPI0035A935D2